MSSLSQFPAEPRAASAELQSLVPGGVALMELRAEGDATALLPEEARHVVRAVPKRVREFAAGRACARAALAGFGVRDFALCAAPDRQPLWPRGFVGSITHTTGFCAAAVGSTDRLVALGLDTEVVGAPTPDIWPTICDEAEDRWLRQLAEHDRPAAITLLFSAKEAFYKCQYPLTSEWLDFHDLNTTLIGWGGGRTGTFLVRANRPLKISAHAPWPMPGRFLFHEQFVSTAVSVTRA